MNALKKIVSELESHIVDINAEIARAETKGFVYARAKEIRKSAQLLKVAAQALRETTHDEFKKAK